MRPLRAPLPGRCDQSRGRAAKGRRRHEDRGQDRDRQRSLHRLRQVRPGLSLRSHGHQEALRRRDQAHREEPGALRSPGLPGVLQRLSRKMLVRGRAGKGCAGQGSMHLLRSLRAGLSRLGDRGAEVRCSAHGHQGYALGCGMEGSHIRHQEPRAEDPRRERGRCAAHYREAAPAASGKAPGESGASPAGG